MTRTNIGCHPPPGLRQPWTRRPPLGQASPSATKYAAKELELLARFHDAAGKVADAERNAGDSILDGESTDAAMNAIVRARAQVAAIEGAIRGCRARRLVAIESKIAAEAADLRKRAGEARAEQERIATKAGRRLKALRELEGCKYMPVPGPFIPASIPQSSRLASQASSLADQAAHLEAAGIPDSGSVQLDDVTSTADLAAAILKHPSDGPSAADIHAWAALCDPLDRFGTHPRSFRVSRADGVMNFADSFIQVPDLAPQGDISIYTGRRLAPDLNRATFRAPVTMQPSPRTVKIAAPVPEPSTALPESPASAPGRLISVAAYLGHESRPHQEDDAPADAVQS